MQQLSYLTDHGAYQCGGLMDKTLGDEGFESHPGRGKCSLSTTAVDAKVKYSLYLSRRVRTRVGSLSKI